MVEALVFIVIGCSCLKGCGFTERLNLQLEVWKVVGSPDSMSLYVKVAKLYSMHHLIGSQ